MVHPLCGGLNCNSAVSGVSQPSYQPKYLIWGGRGGFPNNLATQVSIKRIIKSFIFILITFILIQPTNATTKAELKQRARLLIGNEYEYQCYKWLIDAESNWNSKARNGSHYGIGQMRNAKVATLTPMQQLEWHLRYVGHRYGFVIIDNKIVLNICGGAYRHFIKKGWH